ncbi:MAG: hypothetical protein ACO1RT_13740 [Planctomycetaceae bacterium]
MLRDAFTPPLTLLTEITLLVLMLWPAPVPVVHRHSDSGSRGADRQMVQHLQSHHGGASNAENWPDDWHWHWVCRGNAYVGLASDNAAATAAQMLPREPVDLAEVPCVDFIECLTWDQASSPPKLPEHRRYSFHSVALLSSGLSLPELLGVMRI